MSENENTSKIRIIDFTLILSTFICLLPIVFGLIKWNELPDQIPIHWGLDGKPDSYGSKAIAVFVNPVMCAVINLVYQIIFNFNKKKGTYKGEKLENAVKWLIPFISLVINVIIYTVALGKNLNVKMVIGLLIGFVFVILGNYIPKGGYSGSHRFGLNFKDSDEINDKIKRPLGFTLVILGLLNIGFAFTPFGLYVVLGSIAIYVVLYIVLLIISNKKK